MFNKSFYPTPEPLIRKMFDKLKRGERYSKLYLEPSAGKGDIADFLTKDSYDRKNNVIRRANISVIEKDEDLQAILRGKDYKVIDTDFLTYSGPDQFDVIIANPPFGAGDLHLLKAIDIMYRGEIVFLLNAETLKNPYTNTRKDLVKKLSDLDADIEYIKNAFKDAERPAGVEIALVYIKIERNVEDDLFAGADDTTARFDEKLETNHEVSNRKTVQELVAEYNQIIKIGTETIFEYFKNYKKIGQYIGLNREAEKYTSNGDMTDHMQSQINSLLQSVRTDFWRKTLDIKDVRNRMTEARQKEFEFQIQDRCNMNFTERNIRQFILNLIGNYEDILTKAVLEIFDKFTIRHSYSSGLYDDNIHYFNGWKTNKAFKVGKKVIIPIYGGYEKGPFIDNYSGEWKISGYNTPRELLDIDIVMNYFDGMNDYHSIYDAMSYAFSNGKSRKIESTYFTITAYKKGTLHLVFNDENILRRFNVAACRGKNLIPHDYGQTPYADMAPEKQHVVDSFEGVESYNKNLNQPLFAKKDMLKIAA